MKSVIRFVVAILAVLPIAVTVEARQTPERLFYYADREASYQSLVANIEHIDAIGMTGLNVDEYGVVWGELDPTVVQLAKDHGVSVHGLIKNPGFNQEILHKLLTNDRARARAIASMVELAVRNGWTGIQFDFENINIEDREAYTEFYRETAEALHDNDLTISMAVVHRPDELAGPTRYHAWLFENWRAGYDLEEIGRIGDFVSIMSYSQHTRRMPPGPQAGTPWVRDVVEYFLQHIPANKLSLGIPTGSQHWYTSQEDKIQPEMARSYSAQLSHAWAMHLLERFNAPLLWSEEHEVPYAFFSNGGSFEWIFLEDARSFRSKLSIMDEYGLRGFSVWVLGNEDADIWQVLEERR